MLVVRFFLATGNTHKFVKKLGIKDVHVPIRRNESELIVDESCVLTCSAYDDGASISGGNSGPVPLQVIKFLGNEHDRSSIRGVIAVGNTNFGESFYKAGDVISYRCRVPYPYRFKLMGTDHDVQRVREELEEFFHSRASA